MPTPNTKLHVFICHANQDNTIVGELYQRLLTESWIDPWLGEASLLPGQDWKLETEKAIESAGAVIVCLSSKSVSSEGNVQKDLRFALTAALEKPEGTIFIVPVRFDDCELPRSLKTFTPLDYFPKSQRDGVYQSLLKSLKIREASQPVAESKPRRKSASASPVGSVNPEADSSKASAIPIPDEPETDQSVKPLAPQKKSGIVQLLITILSLPKYLGQFALDLLGRDTTRDSTALVMGWIIVIALLLLAFGIVNVDMLVKLKEAFFPTK